MEMTIERGSTRSRTQTREEKSDMQAGGMKIETDQRSAWEGGTEDSSSALGLAAAGGREGIEEGRETRREQRGLAMNNCSRTNGE